VAWHATTVNNDASWTEVFTSVFEAPVSAVEARIWTEAYGGEYPADLEPYSFATRSAVALDLGDSAAHSESRSTRSRPTTRPLAA